MKTLSRQQLITAGKWNTTKVTTEQGELLLAAPSARAALDSQAKARVAGAEESGMVDLLMMTAVNAEGSPLFASTAEVQALFEVISAAALTEIIKAAGALMAPSVGGGGNLQPSPSAS